MSSYCDLPRAWDSIGVQWGRGANGPNPNQGNRPQQDSHDKMALNVERSSEKNTSFREGGKMGDSSFIAMSRWYCQRRYYEEGTGFRCVCPQGNNGLLNCDRRARIDGSASFVTGTFGMVAASVCINELLRPVDGEA